MMTRRYSCDAFSLYLSFFASCPVVLVQLVRFVSLFSVFSSFRNSFQDIMTSIDHRDAEVQQTFTSLRKAVNESDRHSLVGQISKMYEQNDDYSFGIFSRALQCISESGNRQELRLGLTVLATLGPKMQGLARTTFVNKFHSPIFKLFETNTDEDLLPSIELVYSIILQIGGNRNDSAVDQDLSTSLLVLSAGNSKDIRRISAYSVVQQLVVWSPYITFKRLLQKQRNSNQDNLAMLLSSARSRNIKVRQAYLRFLNEYVRYIAEKKDNAFQKATFARLLEQDVRQHNEESTHMKVETMRIYVQHLGAIVSQEALQMLLKYAQDKTASSLSDTVQKSLIKLLPQLVRMHPSQQHIVAFVKYLRGVQGENQLIAQQSLNTILEEKALAADSQVPREMVSELTGKIRALFVGKHKQRPGELESEQIKTIRILVAQHQSRDYVELALRESIEELAAYALLIRIDDTTLSLLADISQHDIHGLGRSTQVKLIAAISKTLTGSTKRVLRDNSSEARSIIELLERMDVDSEDNKVRAIEALSKYKFREQFRDVVGGFVKDKVLGYYLEWGNPKMRMASVEAALYLYAKKGTVGEMRAGQMGEVLDRLLRVGLTDPEEQVREKVFQSIFSNLRRHKQFLSLFTQLSLLGYLFQSVEDCNEIIRLTALKIICVLCRSNPSALIVPFLKKVTYDCFSQLATGFKTNREKSWLVRAIAILIELASPVIENHANSLLMLLLSHLSDRNTSQGLEMIFFEIFRTLTLNLPHSILIHIEPISNNLLEAMMDKLNSAKRAIALKTFVCIIRRCGYVVVPYIQLPSLVSTLTYLMACEMEQENKTDLMRIIGGLGFIPTNATRKSIQAMEAYQLARDRHIASHNASKQQKYADSSMHNPLHDSLHDPLHDPMRDSPWRLHILSMRQQVSREQCKKESQDQLKLYYNELVLLEADKRLGIEETSEQKVVSISHQPRLKTALQIPFQQHGTNSVFWVLLRMLSDGSLAEKHSLLLQVLSQVLQLLGCDVQKQLDRIVPALLSLTESNPEVLSLLTIISKSCDIGNFLGLVLHSALAAKSDDLLLKILQAICLNTNSRQLLRKSLSAVVFRLQRLVEEQFPDKKLMIRVVQVYQKVGASLEPYLPLVLPQLLEKFCVRGFEGEIGYAVIDFVMSLTRSCASLLQLMPQLLHHYVQILQHCSSNHPDCQPCLRNKVSCSVVLFLLTFQTEFVSYLPLVHRVIMRCEDITPLYFKAIRYLECCAFATLQMQFSEDELAMLEPNYQTSTATRLKIPNFIRKIEGLQELVQEFDSAHKRMAQEDWAEWLKKSSVLLLKKSPSALLRACAQLAEEYNELGVQLYNLSFYYFWQVLQDEHKKLLTDNLRNILTSNPRPPLSVRKTILNLAEFMLRRRCVSFELSNSLLADCAREASAYAKQLYYLQLQFQTSPDKAIEPLIQAYVKLGEPQNAYGLFTLASVRCKTEWYQKIGHYRQAYNVYAKEGRRVHQLRCLSYLDDEQYLAQYAAWKKEYRLVSDCSLKHQEQRIANELHQLAAKAYASLGEWDSVSELVPEMPVSVDLFLWQAIISIGRKEYEEASRHIRSIRKAVYELIPELVNFSSSSEYFSQFLSLQLTEELEEIIAIKTLESRLLKSQAKGRSDLEVSKLKDRLCELQVQTRRTWDDRLVSFPKWSSAWDRLICTRALLCSKLDYFDFYFRYCNICLEQRNISKCTRMLRRLREDLHCAQQDGRKGHGDQESIEEQLQMMEMKVNFASGVINSETQIDQIVLFLEENTHQGKLTSQLYYLCGAALAEKSPLDKSKVVHLLEQSAKLSASQNKWYMLGLMHIEFSESNCQGDSFVWHIEESTKALLRSLVGSRPEDEYFLQGYLKLLSMLFAHCKVGRVATIFLEGFRSVPAECWIHVVPQMIGQLYEGLQDKESTLLDILKQILHFVGTAHPESVLYALNFAVKSKIPERVRPAKQVLEQIRQVHPGLTAEAEQIASELGKAAIKLKEQWYDGIESAWALYNQQKSATAVTALLKELCEEIFVRRQSNSELSFHQQFGQEIREGYNWLLRFEGSHDTCFLSQAFEIFYQVYRKVKDSFEGLRKVFLRNVAPSLVAIKVYSSCIPGTYMAGSQNVRIAGFANELSVLQSKQHPRKLTIHGTDSKEYNFLLKGKEDLRLDERVMQFLNLVNRYLGGGRDKHNKDLEIIRYSIVPLTSNTGLIGWVQQCDTLNELIKEYRQSNKIRLFVEKELYEKMCPEYAFLPMLNRLEIFRVGLQSTQGRDLQKIMWTKSKNCETWVTRRNNYITSLATMSMVGYILGLGDRHPSNIMLQRESGKVLHIDFGDCFEVAAQREKFPEKVPFRLTRMLQKAMGAAGINGLYKQTCEIAMAMLREHKESLFGVLETFAHDPIISWRIVNDKKNEDKEGVKNDPFPMKAQEVTRELPDQLLGSIMKGLQIEITEGKDQFSKEDPKNKPLLYKQNNQQQSKHQINEKAAKALHRIKLKLKGAEFGDKVLSVQQHVARLIGMAISHENICQSWPGWCPYW